MKQYNRRQEIGKVLLDISKYLFTAGIVGGILTDKLTPLFGISIFVVAVAVFIIGAYTIPSGKENR